MFCHKCGTRLEEDALFCNACGTKQESEKHLVTQVAHQAQQDSLPNISQTFVKTLETPNNASAHYFQQEQIRLKLVQAEELIKNSRKNFIGWAIASVISVGACLLTFVLPGAMIGIGPLIVSIVRFFKELKNYNEGIEMKAALQYQIQNNLLGGYQSCHQ